MDNGKHTPRQILQIHQVVAKIGKGKTTIYSELMPKHGFPHPIQIGSQRVGWFEHEIDDWLDQQPRHGAPRDAAQRRSLSPSADNRQFS
jgi:predicted DNA-binding transcriptional regulator AlpA